MFIFRDVQVLKFGIHSLLLSAVAQKVKKRWSNPTVVDLFPSMVNVFLRPCVDPFLSPS